MKFKHMLMTLGIAMVCVPALADEGDSELMQAARKADYKKIMKALENKKLTAAEVQDAKKIVFNYRQPLMTLKGSKTKEERDKVARYTTIMDKLDDWLNSHK